MTQEQHKKQKLLLNLKIVAKQREIRSLRRELRRLEKEKAAQGRPSPCGR